MYTEYFFKHAHSYFLQMVNITQFRTLYINIIYVDSPDQIME